MVEYVDAALLVGRIVFGGYFLFAGIQHFVGWRALAGYARSKGTPAPAAAVLCTGALLAAGGTSIVTGVYPLVGLVLLGLFLLGVTPIMHDFWKVADPQARMAEQVNFMKNTALLGAVLALAAVPQPWAWSLALGA